jgi:hypothetical protein
MLVQALTRQQVHAARTTVQVQQPELQASSLALDQQAALAAIVCLFQKSRVIPDKIYSRLPF